MDKKSRSKPMAEILSRLDPYLFDIIIFGNKCIIEDEVEDWPVVDVLIAFYSAGFPLDKVREEGTRGNNTTHQGRAKLRPKYLTSKWGVRVCACCDENISVAPKPTNSKPFPSL
jgi:hypothetical protein